MRRCAVTMDAATARDLALLEPTEVHAGTSAYRFLLEVATGLRSAVPGETNVFGQVRRAWEAYRHAAGQADSALLGPLVARLIADTRAIRHEHLQDIGGASYGPLVRRLLRAAEGDRILIVGAGELARSLLPFFRAHRVGVWNRRAPGPAFAAAGRVFAPAEGPQAAEWAQHVIMTTPADDANDRLWKIWLGASLAESLVHLGRRRSEPSAWPGHLLAWDLDDLFDLRRSQDNVRSLQLERARHACRERALALATGSVPAARRRFAG
jgi:hypothetical protein